MPNRLLDRSLVTEARFTRLNKLKISARSSSEAPSDVNHRTLTVLVNSELMLAKPGPEKVFRPRLPGCPSAGVVNADAGANPLMKSLRLVDLLFPKEGAFGVS